MNRALVITLTALAALAVFGGGAYYYTAQQREHAASVTASADTLVRAHSPVLGKADAPVTIVEFFDPACETCRAFYPIVKQIMAQHPGQVRLALRYAPFHQGSDQVIKLLEAARKQDLYTPVLEALLGAQPEWADHVAPNLDLAFKIAQDAGLDLARARQDMETPEIQAVLAQDVEDLTALQVRQTPTFFVNGSSLPSFGPE